MKNTVASYLAQRLASEGHRHVFLVTGGGAMFLNDALCHQPDLTPVFFHHEQAAAMAAEAYSRVAPVPAVLNVTTGPGGINALNGVFGAWTDSLPVIVLSGQVKRATCLATTPVPGLRQLGDQEGEIVRMVEPITKYAALIEKPEDVARQLDRALFLATSGRPGPVWLDIPIDVQSAQIDPGSLPRFFPPAATGAPLSTSDLEVVLGKLRAASRPVIIAGTGIRLARATGEFTEAIGRLGVPVTTAWTHDLIASDDPLYCGRPGTIGTRAGNFVVQNADLLLVLGSRLNIRQVSYNWPDFAPGAFKIQVDIDAAELTKPLARPDLALCCHLRDFLTAVNQRLRAHPLPRSRAHARWLAWCKQQLLDFPAVLPSQRRFSGRINPYHFVEELFARLDPDDIVVCANASATIVPFQAAALKSGMRIFSNSGSASMGYDLPAAIGAWYGALAERGKQRRIVCLAGDGSIMMNLQELQTIAHYQLPIKIFVLDNGGYLSIRSSQENFFGRVAGAGADSGLTLPDFVRVARAFGLAACRLDREDFCGELQATLEAAGPTLCQVMLDGGQAFEPRVRSRQLADGSIASPALDDMYPFLDPQELARIRRSALADSPANGRPDGDL